MNNNATAKNKSGKVYTRVVFLMAQNPDTELLEAMAFFPDLYWDSEKKYNVSYMHVGQHGPCCKAFALLDCIAPSKRHKKAVQRLKDELENLDDPYALTVLDTDEWLNENKSAAKEISRNIKIYATGDEGYSNGGCSQNDMTSDETATLFGQFLDDGFIETKKDISAMFDDEFGDIAADIDKDYSEYDDELEYPPVVVEQEPNILEELKADAA